MNPANNNSFNGAGDGHGVYKPFALSVNAPEFVPRGGFMPQPQNGVSAHQEQARQQQLRQQQQQVSTVQYSQQQQQQQAHYQQIVMQHQQQAQQEAQQQHHFNAQQTAAAMQQSFPPQVNYGYQNHRHGGQQQRGPSQQSQPPALNPHDPMAQLKQAILIITKDPTTFDDKMPDLTTTLASNIQTEEKLVKMVEEIFRQSLEEANFRYTGARLCNYFSHHLTVQGSAQSFKQHLLRKCHEEHNKREELVQNCDNRYKLVSFMLFMGELLLNTNEFTKNEETADYTKILSKAVEELLLTLLSQPADDTLRCVVQVLKLCGSVVEDTEKSINPDQATPGLNKIYVVIKSSILESSYIKSLRAQMLSVIELRASDWGRQETSKGGSQSSSVSSSVPPPATQGPTHVPSYNNVPVNPSMYYNNPSHQQSQQPQQQPQQQQQQPNMPAFGSSGFYPEDMYMYSSGDEDYSQSQEDMYYMYNGVECIREDDMDPEIAAAFEEFLQNQPQPQQ